MSATALIAAGAGPVVAQIGSKTHMDQQRKQEIFSRARELRALWPRPPGANAELKELQKEYDQMRKKKT